MNITGACHCGDIQYEAEIDENKVILCHCTDCQEMSGAPYRGVVITTGASLRLQGKIKDYVKTTANSGNPRAQSFCGECGTHIYATSVNANEDPNTKKYNLRLGTVHQREQLSPTIEIWCDSREKWVAPIEGAKQFAGSPA
ncbi:MAG: GFA family protein [Cellvibrionaceae bacterium]